MKRGCAQLNTPFCSYPVDASAIALYQQFVEVLLAVVSRVQQNGGIAYRLLHVLRGLIVLSRLQAVERVHLFP